MTSGDKLQVKRTLHSIQLATAGMVVVRIYCTFFLVYISRGMHERLPLTAARKTKVPASVARVSVLESLIINEVVHVWRLHIAT